MPADPKKLTAYLAQFELEQRRRIDASLDALITDTRFADFMLEVASLREMSLDSLSEVEVIKSDRATLCAISEASAFKKLLNIYEDKKNALMAKAELEKQRREEEAEAAKD